MKRVSEGSEELLSQLVAWEMLGRVDLDPKTLLRQVPLADLSVVACNLGAGDEPTVRNSVSVQMVALELNYRTGKLGGDWGYAREGDEVTLSIPLSAPVSFQCIPAQFHPMQA